MASYAYNQKNEMQEAKAKLYDLSDFLMTTILLKP